MTATFRLERPTAREAPVVVEVPHAGLEVPASVRASLRVSDEAICRDADAWVDELWLDAPSWGATLLVANVSRYVVDLNRDADDIDARAVRGAPRADGSPRGVIWREAGDGQPALAAPLEWEQYQDRVDRYWRPYHDTLTAALESLHRRHGRVLLLSGHSMPSMGRAAPGEPARRRADVVPGTRGRSTAEVGVIDEVARHFSAAGLSVRHDDPYRGGATTARWGRPAAGYHAVQIELSRALYMDESTLRRRPQAMKWVRGVVSALVERVCAGA